MLSPITKDISGFSVRFRPLPATRAFTLAKRVGSLVLPVLKSLDLSKPEADVDMSSLLDSVSSVLGSLCDSAAVSIIVDSLQGCTVTAPGQPAVEIQDAGQVDAVFQGELETMYQVILESWKYNRLIPFKLAARFGIQTSQTPTSEGAAGTGTGHGVGLALSGTSPQK